MALNRGWNREEMQQVGAVFNEASTTDRDPNFINRVVPSFTPINYNSHQLRFVSPMKTLISRALDSDALYALADEVLPEVAPPKGRKRGVTWVNKGRTVSLGAVWEHNDDGDFQFGVQGGGTDDHVPKKQKLAPLKRSKSTKATSKTLSKFWDSGDLQQDQAHPDEQQASQLTTPPDSSKKGKKRAESSTSQSKGKKTNPFKNPIITKPSVARENVYEDVIPSSKPVSTHPSWTTTEDAVKLNSNGIAKTTLDRLTAFRYKSTADPAVPTSNLPAEYEGRSKLDSRHEFQFELQQFSGPSIDHGPCPNRHTLLQEPSFQPSEAMDSLEETKAKDPEPAHFPSDNDVLLSQGHDNSFADALWNANSSSQAFPSNTQKAANLEVGEPELEDHVSQPEHQVQQHLQPTGSIHFDHSSPQLAPDPLDVLPETSASTVEPIQLVADCFEPTSSDARALRSLLDPVSFNQSGQQVSERSEVATPVMQNGTTTHLEQSLEVEHPHDSKLLGKQEATKLQGNLPAIRTNFEELPPMTASFEHPRPKGRVLRPLTEIQRERSDIDDVESVPRNISIDYESDEFDEGLDDNDLFAILSDSVVPETQFNVKPNGSKNYELHSQNQHIGSDPTTALNEFASGKLVDLTLEGSNLNPAIESHRPRTLRILGSEPDDECPMDQWKEDVFKMPDVLTSGVFEHFQAPPSLQYAFADEAGSGEVYDSSLQFSLPKHRDTPVSPTKVPSDLHIDQINVGSSPARCSDIELLPTGEEEDWNFLRSNHIDEAEVQAISKAVSVHQRQTTRDGMERRESIPSPGSTVHREAADSAVTPSPATQTDPSSIMWILDDRYEYRPLQPFARPDFPILIRDRSPITGVSAQTFLRVCFRIGEMFKEGARCAALKQDAVIELFARVTFSSRESGTAKQHFQFADLWHDRPPFPNGILTNYKTTVLAESESKAFLGADEGTIARCLGRLKRNSKSGTGWILHIITIRMTDWEEIKYTKRIVSAGRVKSEKGLSKL